MLKSIIVTLCVAFSGMVMAQEATSTAPSTIKAKDYDAMVKESCECMKDLFPLMESLKKAQEEEQMEKLMELTTQMMAKATEIEECTDKLEKKYGKMEGADVDEEAVKASMKKHCPKMYSLMQAGKE